MAVNWIASDAETSNFKTGTFLKLSDCPADFQNYFKNARQAIESGDLDGLKKAVADMKGSGGVPSDQCLNVCEMVPTESGDEEYAVSLLALAGYHVQKDMLTFLQSEKADFDMGNMESGSPLIQMMIYAYIKQTEEGLSSPQFDVSIVKFFTDHGTVLSRVLMAPEYDKSTALELAISFQQLDIVQVLIEAGADPILCGDGVVSPLLVEYTLFGTFSFIRWLLENHLGQSEIPGFIDRLLETGVLFRDNMKNTVMEMYGRSPAHAFLLCRHKEAIDYLVQRRRELLEECDPFGRTALHLAAEEGDLESVRILLDCNADIEVEDKSLMTPLMLATKNEHEEVVREIEMFASRAGKSEDPMGLWAWALQHGYTSYFETLHRTHELEEVLKKPIDSNGNTIAHVAAEGNHVSVFKTTFPKTKSSENLYEILMIQNSRNKTPLQLAIDNGNVGILTGLQERKKEREKAASRTEDWSQKQVVSVEKREWKDFWDIESPGLLLYACSHGTVETVKYFTTRLVPPTTRYADGLTPLSVAAKAGKHEIVAYLLSIPGVSAEGVAAEETRGEVEKQHSPLMLASKYGHSKCVQLLLEKEADIGVVSDRGYNCLMESIDRGHKSVAVTFVTDSKTWKGSMRHCVPEDGRFLTPIRMLIESMPGVSKMVLTKCVEPPTRHSQEVVYDFEFIEDYVQPSSEPRLELQSGGGATTPESFQFSRLSTPSSGGTASGSSQGHRPRGRDAGRRNLIKPSDYKGLEHPLMLMVKNERLDLLKHPLIRRYIHYKWWRISFPVFLTVLSLYVLFLVFLASFSLLIPRPGPESTYCPSNDTTAGYTQDNLGAGVCKDPDELDQRAFSALAVILIIMSVVLLTYEIIFHLLMRETRDISDFIQLVYRVLLFVLTIVFVSGFANDCWCAPPWQWQIGALVMFMAFFNFVLLLKGLPWFGVPINMLLNIIAVFLRLVYLPILLILSFAFPFYMLFVRGGDADAGVLTAFSTFPFSLSKVVMQTAGELDYGNLFEEASLLYTPMAIILFVTFVVLMPVLFSNLLVGLAVGTAEEDTKKAELTNIRLQVEYIVQLENLRVVRHLAHLPQLNYSKEAKRNWFLAWKDKMTGVDYDTQAELVVELHESLQDSDGGSKETVEEIKEKVTEMAALMESLQMSISVLQKNNRHLHETVKEVKETGIQNLQEQMNKILKKVS